jgi:hypothetical protein
VIGRCLPAPGLNQVYRLVFAHSHGDQRSSGQQNAAAYSMLTVYQNALAILYLPIYPGGSLTQLRNGQRKGVGRGQVEQLDALTRHLLGVVLMFTARVYDSGDAGHSQPMDILRQDPATNRHVRRNPAHIQPIRQRDTEAYGDGLGPRVFWEEPNRDTSPGTVKDPYAAHKHPADEILAQERTTT